MKEGDQSVLDNSTILYGSGRDGDSHNPRNLPILLGGGGGGRIHSASISKANYTACQSLRGLLHAFGCGIDRFADSTEMLPGLLSASREHEEIIHL